jgi:hypothetical protein
MFTLAAIAVCTTVAITGITYICLNALLNRL